MRQVRVLNPSFEENACIYGILGKEESSHTLCW